MKYLLFAARSTLLVTLLGVFFFAQGAHRANAAGVVGNGTSASCTEAALNTALNGGGSVTFNCGPIPHTITITGYKQIANNTTIDGGSKITLSASNTYHFQVFVDKSLTIKNIKLSNGNTNFTAGSIENFGTTIATNVTFTKNKTTEEGGAILNRGTLTVKNSFFTKNKAAKSGGAIWNDDGDVKVKGTTFKGNKATGPSASGGAIANIQGDLRLINSTLLKNKADEGGAVYAANDSFNSIKKSTLKNNKGHNGGALENFGGMQVISSVFEANTGTGMGGGIYQGGSMSISKTTVKTNHGDRGAEIFISAESTAIFQSTISGNIAVNGGGGVFSESDTSIENSTLSGNNAGAGQGGGGWFQHDDETTFQFVTIANNTATFGAGLNADAGSSVGTVTLQNTALSSNPGGNCAGGFNIVSSGHNLSTDTFCGALNQPGDKNNTPSNLGGLTNNGGPTETHLPQPGSQLINNGLNIAGINTDQRGFPRPGPSNAKSDIGSVEVQ